jgi:hypothetical protein
MSDNGSNENRVADLVETYPDLQIRNQGLADWVKPIEVVVKP